MLVFRSKLKLCFPLSPQGKNEASKAHKSGERPDKELSPEEIRELVFISRVDYRFFSTWLTNTRKDSNLTVTGNELKRIIEGATSAYDITG